MDDEGAHKTLDEHTVHGASKRLPGVEAAPDSFADGANVDTMGVHCEPARHSCFTMQVIRGSTLGRRLRLLLTRKLADAVAAGRQLRFLDHQHGKPVLDLEAQRAPRTHQVVAFEGPP